MKDYGQVLTGQGQGQTGQGQGSGQQQRSRNRNRNRNRQSNSDTQDTQVANQGIPRRTKFALANSLGASAEAAKGLGISRRQAHRIIDTAFGGNTGSDQNLSE